MDMQHARELLIDHAAAPGDPANTQLWLALGWAHVDTSEALDRLEAVLATQEPDGRLPLSTADPLLTTLTALPLAAFVLQRIVQQNGDPARCKALVVRLDRQHAWFWKNRDPLSMKWVTVRHPWESGETNSPVWDTLLGFSEDDPPPDDDQRAQALNELAHTLQQKPDAFSVYNPFLSAILVKAEEILTELGRAFRLMLGSKRRAAVGRSGLLDRPWDGSLGRFRYIDHLNGRSAYPDTLPPLLPALMELPGHMKKQVLAILANRYSTPYGIPTLPPDHELFASAIPWRGAVDLELNWWLSAQLGAGFVEDTLRLVNDSGCFEHYDSQSGHGIEEESVVAAAVALDLATMRASNA